MVTGAAKGGQNQLVRGWLVDKLVRKAGFPRAAVEAAVAVEERESLALEYLGRRLCGWDEDAGWGLETLTPADPDEERDILRDEEVLALEALLGERFREEAGKEGARELVISVASAPDDLTLHVVFDSASPYPSAQYPTRPPAFYLTSNTLPAYMRLALHADMLRQFRGDRHDLVGMLEAGSGGVVLSMVEHLETSLPDVVANPPNVADVTKHLVPRPDDDEPEEVRTAPQKEKKTRGKRKHRAATAEQHEAARQQQKRMMADPAYEEMMRVRRSLPAWKERENICRALESNRVLVVVGETGLIQSLTFPLAL
ncbi:ATP-dependent RNA helicase A [Trichosporon asahii var. asahii CBS 8904]|uniref:ATP-dependent RNA helicase A n=1 Tax=Trichosporon asahii var. asahii (strain CBS 8904) TaxID=1220162 RepID=K1VYI1_TRIAC|nr:ATP-dependent RNA helicase A [Trichosporon asahii var. asahii CBS 8904]